MTSNKLGMDLDWRSLTISMVILEFQNDSIHCIIGSMILSKDARPENSGTLGLSYD